MKRSYLQVVSTNRAMQAVLALVLIACTAPRASATLLTVETDGSWLAKNVLPGAGWNTNAAFNTAADGGWINASVNIADCALTADCIWYDGQFSATQNAFLRQTFTVNGPILSGDIIGGIDDDADIWINGTLVFSDHNGFAQAFGPINIAPFLVQGMNLVAVQGWDNFPVFGQNHDFVATITVETASVPEPTSLLLLATGLTLFARRRSQWRRPERC